MLWSEKMSFYLNIYLINTNINNNIYITVGFLNTVISLTYTIQKEKGFHFVIE